MVKDAGHENEGRYRGRYTAPLPIKAIADILGVHPDTASHWLRTGQLKAKRVGSRWRLHEEELPVELPPPKPKRTGKRRKAPVLTGS